MSNIFSDPMGAASDAISGASDYVSNAIGTPGHNKFTASPYQVDPNAYKNPYLTAGADTVGSQANLNQDVAGLTHQMGTQGYNAANAGLGTLAGNLQSIASGAPGTSIAQQQLANNVATNNANAMGMASSMNGVNPALAARAALGTVGANNLGAASNAAMAGIAERNAANQALANVYGEQGQLGLGQQNTINSATQGLTGEAMGAQNAQLNAQIAQQGQQSSNYNQAQALNAGVSQANAQNGANLFGGAMGAAGSLLTIPGLAGGGISGAFTAFADDYTHTPKRDSGFGGSPSGVGDLSPGSGAAPLADDIPDFETFAPLAAGAAAKGAVIPGVDHGVDESIYALRPDEVVTPPENPIHPFVKRAVQDPRFAASLARHLIGLKHAAGGTVVPPAPVPAPTPTPAPMSAPAPVAVPRPAPRPVPAKPSLGGRIFDTMKDAFASETAGGANGVTAGVGG